MTPAAPPVVPARIGPAEIALVGALVAVRCPSDLAPLVKQAGALWEAGSGRWLRRAGDSIR